MIPPSAFVMATTDGRGGMFFRKSGQRVDGFSKVDPISSGVLNGGKESPVVRRKAGAAEFRAARRSKEALGEHASFALNVRCPDTIGNT